MGSRGVVLDISDSWSPRRVTDTEVAGSERRFRFEPDGRTVLACCLVGSLCEPLSVEARTPTALRSAQVQADYYIVCPDEFVGAARLLAPLELELGPGGVVGLLGPNGAGKTTTIRMILDIVGPD